MAPPEPAGAPPQRAGAAGGPRPQARSHSRCPLARKIGVARLKYPPVCCTPGWDRSVLIVTFLRRYSADPVWDTLGARATLVDSTA